jgi:hypothetical protein
MKLGDGLMPVKWRMGTPMANEQKHGADFYAERERERERGGGRRRRRERDGSRYENKNGKGHQSQLHMSGNWGRLIRDRGG